MYGSIDRTHKPKKLELFLAKPDGTILGKLTEKYGARLSVVFDGINEITFNLPLHITKNHVLTDNPHIALIKERYLIKAVLGNDVEWYVITQKRKVMDDTADEISLLCKSRLYELNYKRIPSLELDTVTCQEATETVLEGTNWTLSYVDPQLSGTYRTIETTSKKKLQALNEIKETFGGVFITDTTNRTLSIYHPDNVGANNRFRAKLGEYLRNLEEVIELDELVTRMYIYGQDRISVQGVNPSGQPYAENYTPYLYPFARDGSGNVLSHSDYMSDSLCHAILDYNELLQTKEGEFDTLLTEKETYQTQLQTKKNELSTLDTELKEILNDIEIATENDEPTATLIAQRNAKMVEIDTKKSEIATVETNIADVDADISTLKNSLSYASNFTLDQLAELTDFIQEDEWSDENYVDENDLWTQGWLELEKRNSPPVNLSIGLVNFLECITEQRNWDKIVIGDFVRTYHEPLGIDITARMTRIEYDFESGDISLEISNGKKMETVESKLIKAVYKSNNIVNEYQKKKYQYENVGENFLSRNDRKTTIPANPTVASDGTALNSFLNDDSTATIVFRWNYNDFTITGNDAHDIDGFYVYVKPQTVNDSFVFGSNVSKEERYDVPFSRKNYILQSVTSNTFYTFGVQAYRKVDNDISSTGELVSEIVQSTFASENPYQPSADVIFLGDISDSIGNKSSATFVIGVEGSSNNINQADYKVPAGSTSAEDIINEVIDNLPSSGGEIVLLDGTFIVDGSIIIPSNVSIKGQGSSTTIKIKDNHNTNLLGVFQNSDAVGGNTYINLSSFKLDGNKSNNSAPTIHEGIQFTNTSFSIIRNVDISNFLEAGTTLYSCSNISFSGNIMKDNKFGINLALSNHNTISGNIFNGSQFSNGSLSESNNNSISANIFQGSTDRSGLYVWNNSENNAIVGNTFQNNYLNGLLLSSNNNIVSGNSSQGNNVYGIYLSSANNNIIVGNTCKDNSQDSDNTYSNILLLDSSFNNIQNNICRVGSLSNKAKYGISISSTTCVSNIVANNDISNGGVSGNFSDSGVDTNTGLNSLTGNRDYVTTGTASSGTSSTIVLSLSAATVIDIYNGFTIFIVSGTGVGQDRIISDYSGTTRVVTVTLPWSTNPDATSVYEIR